MIAWTPASMPFSSKEIARPPGSERPSSHPAATDHNEGFTTAGVRESSAPVAQQAPGTISPPEIQQKLSQRALYEQLIDYDMRRGPGGVVARLERACHPRDQRVRRLSVGRAMASERGQATIEWTGVLSSQSPWRRWRLRCRGWTAVAWAGRPRLCPGPVAGASARGLRAAAQALRRVGNVARRLWIVCLGDRRYGYGRGHPRAGRRGDAAGRGPRSRQRVPEPAWVADGD
jgi:hypothetical protein